MGQLPPEVFEEPAAGTRAHLAEALAAGEYVGWLASLSGGFVATNEMRYAGDP